MLKNTSFLLTTLDGAPILDADFHNRDFVDVTSETQSDLEPNGPYIVTLTVNTDRQRSAISPRHAETAIHYLRSTIGKEISILQAGHEETIYYRAWVKTVESSELSRYHHFIQLTVNPADSTTAKSTETVKQSVFSEPTKTGEVTYRGDNAGITLVNHKLGALNISANSGTKINEFQASGASVSLEGFIKQLLGPNVLREHTGPVLGNEFNVALNLTPKSTTPTKLFTNPHDITNIYWHGKNEIQLSLYLPNGDENSSLRQAFYRLTDNDTVALGPVTLGGDITPVYASGLHHVKDISFLNVGCGALYSEPHPIIVQLVLHRSTEDADTTEKATSAAPNEGTVSL